jgi:hypothetical protein
VQDRWFYVSFYELLGIPEGVPVSATVLFFLISCAPFLSGQKAFGTEFPKLSSTQRALCLALGPVALALVIFGFQKSWQDGRQLAEAQPYCFIERVWLDETSFDLNWFTTSESHFLTRFVGSEGLEVVSSDGTRQQTWDSPASALTYRIMARNRFGTCTDTVDVWNPGVDWDQPIDCEISIDQETAAPGDRYRVEWSVDAPELALAWVNGSEVDHQGGKTFTFSAENYSRFRLVVNSGGRTCEANARIVAQ